MPLIEVNVFKSEEGCPPGTEDVFYKDWLGMDLGCDCLRSADPWITYDFTMIPSYTCSYNETRAGCLDVPAINPVRQNKFWGQQVCGRREGVAYMNSTLPLDGSCPEPTKACPGISLENTICVEQQELCPITFLQFLTQA